MKNLLAAVISIPVLLSLIAPLSISAKDGKKALLLWKQMENSLRLDFHDARPARKGLQGWIFQGKPFTKETRFTLVQEGKKRVLKVESRKGSGSILLNISKVPLKDYPILRWKWKVEKLPEGGDGRVPRKDDQALGIYVGAGRSKTSSLAFRWETTTPAGCKGSSKYGMGLISVKWESFRSQNDPLNEWVEEEVNLYEKLNKLFKGRIPEKDLALSISGNSQYTGTASCGYIAYLELVKTPSQAGKKQN